MADVEYPQGFRNIDMTTNSIFLRFQKDTIHSEMPFLGRAYSGVAYSSNGGGGGGGLDFKGAVKNYFIKKGKKSYTIKATVKGNADWYDVF